MGLIDELKKYLSDGDESKFDTPPQSELQKLQEQLGLEKDPARRKLIQQKIDQLEVTADKPTQVLGTY